MAVFTVPDVGGRPDPLAEIAEGDGVPVLKFKQWRKKGQIIPEVHVVVNMRYHTTTVQMHLLASWYGFAVV